MATYTCRICGATEDTERWNDSAAKPMLEEQMCHRCHHWHIQKTLDDTERKPYGFAIIDGHHYVLKPYEPNGFNGSCGRKHIIIFNDGHREVCSSLWHQGEIPEGHWRSQMPDNAVFEQN